MRAFSSFIVFLMISHSALSQEIPGWVDPEERSSIYPEAKYLVCFKSDIAAKGEDPAAMAEILLKLAKTQLVEQIRVSIKNSVSTRIENVNTRTKENFLQASTATSEASLAGLRTETCYNKKKKDKEVCVIAVIKKSDLIAGCKTGITDLQGRINRKLDLAKQLAASGETEKAISAYYECFPLISDLSNDMAILVSLGLDEGVSTATDPEMRVTQGISEVRKGKELDLDQACFFIANGLKQQLKGLTESGEFDVKEELAIGGFLYQDSRMGSEFSARISAILEQKLTSLKIPAYSSADIKNSKKSGDSSRFMLTGSYWVEGNRIKIIANVRNCQTGSTVASGQEYLPMSWFSSNGVKYLPDNYEIALAREKALSKNELPLNALQVDVWTNKGSENPVFKDKDTMLLYMKVNRPCFIRMIYYLSDGRKTLLVDNKEITPDQVGKVFQFPDVFICSSPFGSEALQVCAQTEPFKTLSTKMDDGYRFILDNVEGILANTRGMKSASQQFRQSETRLDLTTVEK
ncbi:MAG: hypothetical protein WCK92_11590 [Bacteroidota bacterium]